jgi:hypothetical protein
MVTEEMIERLVYSIDYTRLGVKTTVCLVTLKNGFELVGTSACVDPKNYIESTGREIALKDALDKMWMLEGYRLQCEGE